MQKRKKYWVYLLISILSLVGFLLFVNTFDPNSTIDIFSIKLFPVIPFFILGFLTISCLLAFILANSRRGALIGLLVTTFLLFQYLHINNVFNTTILIAIVILLELLFWKKK